MPNCLNCNQSVNLSHKYCTNCGQKTVYKRLSFWIIIKDFFSNLFNVEAKIWKTFIDIWKPGKLAIAYIEGRRERYYNPLRIFILILFGFFALFLSNFADASQTIEKYSQEQEKKQWEKHLAIKFDSITNNSGVPSDSLIALKSKLFNISESEMDSTEIKELQDSINQQVNQIIKDSDDTSLLDSFEIRMEAEDGNLFLSDFNVEDEFYSLSAEELKKKYGQGVWYKELIYVQLQKIVKNLSTSLSFFISNGTWAVIATILLMAWAFKLLYFRQNYLFAEHFIFHLYGHTRLLLMSIIGMLIKDFIGAELILWILPILAIWYLYAGMRKFYQQSRGITFFKFIISLNLYVMVSSLCFIMIMGISLLVL